MDTGLRRDRPAQVFALLVGLLTLHVAFEAAVRGGWRLLELPVGFALAPAALAVFVRSGRRLRTLTAGVLGLAALGAGLAVYAPQALIAGIGGASYTGILAMLAGIGLVALAVRVALAGRRLRAALVAISVLYVLLQWLVIPALDAGVVTNAPHQTVARASTLGLSGAREVTFNATDGVRLRGWYVPGRNGSAVIVMHGSHANRSDTRDHVELLARLGYAVLAYDARGHGQSDGSTNALGWSGVSDLRGAINFLRGRPGVAADGVDALGLSMGAEIALRGAAAGLPLRAVVADGAGTSTLGDERLVDHGLTAPIFLSSTWISMRVAEVVGGVDEPTPLKDVVGHIRIPVLLIASHRTHELAVDRAFRARIGPSALLWYVADAGHTRALERHPAAYNAHLRSFLAAAKPKGQER